MAKSDLRIDILETSITISADEDPGYLNTLLEKYRRTVENVKRISGLQDPLKIAVLTGFLLSDDLEKAGRAFPAEKAGQSSGNDESAEAEQLTLGMISRLDKALSAPVPAGDTNTNEAVIPDTRAAETLIPGGEKPASVFKLQNTVKNYDWGSPEWIPSLLGERNLSRIPWAELWMGVNPAGPSRVVPFNGDENSAPLLLSELIKSDPDVLLGKESAGKFGTLPFLFKVEAAAKPLSIQAHPNREQAREGFDRENHEGIPLDAPHRNYRDSNHKPEIICALTTFAALCGFREAEKTGFLLEILLSYSDGALKNGLESLVGALEKGDGAFKTFLGELFNLQNDAKAALAPFIKTRQARLERDYPEYRDEWGLCSYLAGLYPGDPGILAPLYLNIIELAPGEAMYLPAGVFHAYVHGLGIELMADSDNVLRGGLTPKHIDQPELFRVLNFSEYKPEILKAPEPAPEWFRYPAPSEEFSLSVMRGAESAVTYPETRPAIVIITEGSAAIGEADTNEVHLAKGESVFIPAGKEGKLVFKGSFTAYAAAAGKGESASRESAEEAIPPGQIP